MKQASEGREPAGRPITVIDGKTYHPARKHRYKRGTIVTIRTDKDGRVWVEAQEPAIVKPAHIDDN